MLHSVSLLSQAPLARGSCALPSVLFSIFYTNINLYIFFYVVEIGDFIIDTPECLLFKFTRKAGIQKECAFIRIVEDSIKEGNEQFSVSLSSFNSQVVFGTEKATITIVEEDAPIPATKAPS